MKKPKKLKFGDYRATVVKVRTSTGVRAAELAWNDACGFSGPWARPYSEIFEEFAKLWWADTDQSGNCQFRLRIESWEGRVLESDVSIAVELKAEALAIVDRSPVKTGGR